MSDPESERIEREAWEEVSAALRRLGNNPAEDCEATAAHVVDGLSDNAVLYCAWRYLCNKIQDDRRERVLRIEREAAAPERRRKAQKAEEGRKLREGQHDQLVEKTGLFDYLEAWKQEIKLEATAELLASRFSLPSGREVTWGEATVQDHQERVDMLIRNVEGLSETTARHQLAIEIIQAAGAANLSETTRTAA